MRFFTDNEIEEVAAAMLLATGVRDPSFLGTLSGFKRRARARAVIEYVEHLAPPPPDHSITTVRMLMRRLFQRAVSNNDLERYFATAGRKASDRVDMPSFEAWYVTHEPRNRQQAEQLVVDLEAEWRQFTMQAAHRAGQLRRKQRGKAAAQ
jgi:hypothetical protein